MQKIHIIHTNDIHAFITDKSDAIGFPKIGGFIEHFKKLHPNTLVLDAGDAYNGSPYASFDSGKSIVALQNTLGLDAACAGNADFILGAEKLGELAVATNFPLLSANILVKSTRQPFLPGTTTVLLPCGLRAGIVALSTQRAAAGVSFESGNTIDIAKQAIASLHGRADLIIGLFHMGDTERVFDSTLSIADKISGFDIIIDGHSHSLLPRGRVQNGTLIAQTGEYCKYIGLVTLEVEGSAGACKVLDAKARLLDKHDLADIPEKQETRAVLDDILQRGEAFFEEVVGSTDYTIQAIRNEARTGETTGGDLFIDAIREAAKTTAAVCIAGAVGGDIKAGVINRRAIMTMVRVDATIIRQEIRGGSLLKALAASCSSYPVPVGTFLQVSGISFKINPQAQGLERVYDVQIAGEPLVAEHTYTIAYLDCMQKMAGLNEGKNLEGNCGTCQDALLAYLAKHSPLQPGEQKRIIIDAPKAY